MLTKIAYRGWPNVYRLSNGHIELLITADMGPRILSYGLAGRDNTGANNLFKEIESARRVATSFASSGDIACGSRPKTPPLIFLITGPFA
jgi:hypothetical protein